MLIPVEEILEWLVTILGYWSEAWNKLNVPITELWEPSGFAGLIDDLVIDKFLELVGLQDVTMLGFTLGVNITIFVAIIMYKWISAGIKMAS